MRSAILNNPASLVSTIPFHKPYFDQDEISEIADSIKSGWWTLGPKTKLFEKTFGEYIGSKYSISTNSWTSAGHLALNAIGLQSGDEVIVPAYTFAATSEIVCYFNAKPVFADVDRHTGNIATKSIEKLITNRTKAIIPVHYAGVPCNLDEIYQIAKSYNLRVIEDAAHALPSEYKGGRIGAFGDIICFSFYATKTLATGDGGMICTSDDEISEKCQKTRLHGMDKDAWGRYDKGGDWYYDITDLGYKYNFNDLLAGLGLAQLRKIDFLYQKRLKIAKQYNLAFQTCDFISLLTVASDRKTSWHLYPIFLNLELLSIDKATFLSLLKEKGIGCGVHFIPLYRFRYYRNLLNHSTTEFPNCEYLFERQISLPIYPGMNEGQISQVIDEVITIGKKYRK